MDLQHNIDIGIASDKAKTGASRVRQALDSIIRKSKQMASSSERDTRKIAGGFSKIRNVVLALGGALAARSMVTSTRDFGQAVADLSAITGATGRDLEFLRQKSKEFGETTTLSASEAAEAFRLIASAKPDLLTNVEALSTVTKEAIALAEATGSTLPQAADTLGSALNQFNSGADQASRFINVLAAGSKFGAAQVHEIAEALKFAGGIASNMANISFEETNASLQLMSQFAIKGGEAGTQLRMVLLALETQSNDKFKPSVVGLQGALDNLAKAQLTTAEVAKLFGSRNANAATILIQQRDRVEELTNNLTDSTIAYEQQSTRVDTLAGDVKALKSAYEGLELTIGAELEGSFRRLTQAATDNIRALSQNPLLKKGIRATLNTISIAIQDVRNVLRSLTETITGYGQHTAVFEGIWEGAIERIVRWTQFLWQQFIVGGPANLKLAATLGIAAFDKLRIGMVELVRIALFAILGQVDVWKITFVEKVSLIIPAVERIFTVMTHAVGRAFDRMRIGIGDAIDMLAGEIQQRIFDAARKLRDLGFDDMSSQLLDVGIALGNIATQGTKARQAAEEHERVRQQELQAIEDVIQGIKNDGDEKRRIARQTSDELIAETERVAETQRQASRDAVQLAIEERDAAIETMEALREKNAVAAGGGGSSSELGGAGPAGATGAGGGPADPATSSADEAVDSYEKLGETGKTVAQALADGFTDMARDSKASFKDMITAMIRDLALLALRTQLLKGMSKILGSIGFGSGGEASVTSGGVIPKAATGLDFMVGGHGGTDSQLVAFRATPGESVSVKTPQQQKNASEGGGINLTQTNIIHAEGADAGRIEAMLPGLLEQTRQRTLDDVIKLRNRGALRK